MCVGQYLQIMHRLRGRKAKYKTVSQIFKLGLREKAMAFLSFMFYKKTSKKCVPKHKDICHRNESLIQRNLRDQFLE